MVLAGSTYLLFECQYAIQIWLSLLFSKLTICLGLFCLKYYTFYFPSHHCTVVMMTPLECSAVSVSIYFLFKCALAFIFLVFMVMGVDLITQTGLIVQEVKLHLALYSWRVWPSISPSSSWIKFVAGVLNVVPPPFY